MLRIHQIKLQPKEKDSVIVTKIAQLLKVKKNEILSWKIRKKSYDCRKKPLIWKVYTVDVEVLGEEKIVKRFRPNQVMKIQEESYTLPQGNPMIAEKRPTIVGMGPAGLFCALALCEMGCQPILIERGSSVEKRVKDVQNFWSQGILNEQSNVQFGEGGAGTFSDGKLQTGVNDKRIRYILEQFVWFGASPEILTQNRPHIGTDVLRRVLISMREYLLERGTTIFFDSQVTDLKIENQQLKGVWVKEKYYPTEVGVFSIGHSARDTFLMLHQRGLKMESKAFAVGVRIEHPQSVIDLFSYGEQPDHWFPPADYKLVYHGEQKKTCYSFCMCPGGYVVAASSEKEALVVNGMSNEKRNAKNANSALLVPVEASETLFGGVEFQRELEKKAFLAGGENYFAPIQKVGDFLKKQKTMDIGEVEPSYCPGVKGSNFWEILPRDICQTLQEAILDFGKKIPGFDSTDAILTGVETRSSSPVRIWRDESLESNIKGIYPAGEGAGYAGGITSSAIDGLKIAEQIHKRYSEMEKK